jgi:tetratricopeptide (TPR) repeat protein
MKPRLILTAFPLLFFASSIVRAEDPDIGKYLSRVEQGEADAVRSEVPSLLSRYPNNPGVLYLQGVLTTDGTEAVRIYQSIVDNFPKSEWADDALYKVYQFYYAIGLYRTAEIKLNQLKTDYPQSRYLVTSASADTKNLPEEKVTSGPVGVVADSSQQPVPAAIESPDVAPKIEEQQTRGQYTLQVGAYSQQVNAEKQKLFFEDLGYSVEVINKVSAGRSLFVVLVGDYASSDDARAKRAEFKKTYNTNSMVVTR